MQSQRPPLEIRFVQTSRNVVVVVPRVSAGQPSFCVHGKTRCCKCDEWVWLGSTTVEVVTSGQASPLCMTCATGTVNPLSLIGHAVDHQR